jgi:hypothetical protein
MRATEAVAAIIPLKITSASPFVLESDLLDFGPYLIGRFRAVYPEMAARLKTRLHPVAPERFTKPDPNV